MNVVKEIQRINKKELELSLDNKASWHDEYKDSAYIFIGGLDYDLTEGDILAVFSQYGEIVNINLVRDKRTNKSKGFCFLAYEDQRSTTLAVDNLNGTKITGRTLRVDHVRQYRRPRDENGEEIIEKGCAPKTPTPSPSPERRPSPVKIKKDKKKRSKRDSSLSDDYSHSSPEVKRKRKHSPEVKRKKKHKEKKKKKYEKAIKQLAQMHKEEVLQKQKEAADKEGPNAQLPGGSQAPGAGYLLNPKGAGSKQDGDEEGKEEKPKFQRSDFFDANNPFGTVPKKTYDYRYDFGRDAYKPTRYN